MSVMASVLRYSDYGDPGKVMTKCMEKLETPEGNQLLVKILIAPINPADINTIQGE
jgi:trans-2-enoyl-CoA reductase